VQSPGVQQRVAEKAVGRFTESLGAKAGFSSVSIQAPGSFMIRDLLLKDSSPYTEDAGNMGFAPVDTMLYAREVYATISPRALLNNRKIRLKRLDLKGVSVAFASEPDADGKRSDNFTRVLSAMKLDSTSTPLDLYIARLNITDFRFRFKEFMPKVRYPKGPFVDFNDIDARASHLKASDFSIRDGYYSADIEEAEVSEKSGAAHTVSGRLRIGNRQAVIKDLRIKDAWSDFHAPLYSMTSIGEKAYKHYVSQVRMKLKADKGTLSWNTIRWYTTGALYDSDFLLKLDNIDAEGYVNDLNIKRIKFTDLYGGMEGDVSGRITGITVTPDLLVEANVNKLKFTTEGAEKFLKRMAPGANLKLSGLAKGQALTLDASAKGRLDKLAATARIDTRSAGLADAVVSINGLRSSKKGTEIAGTLKTKNLSLGKITGKDFLGEVTANSGFKANFSGKNMSVRVDSLMVDRLGLLGYDYTGVAAAGTYSGNSFDGKIICADPNLNFIFQGIFNFSPKTNNALYKFSANVGYADLEALHLDTRGGSSKISLGVNTNFMKIPRGDLLGDINISDLTLENDNGFKYIGDIYVGSHANGDINRLQFQSSFLDAGYVGDRSIANLLDDLQTITTRRELPSLYSKKDKDKGDPTGKYDISVNFHDSRDILSFIKPGLYIADSTSIDLRTDGNGQMRGRVRSPRLAYRTDYLKGLDISVDNMGGSANATLLTDELMLSKIGFCNSAFTAFAQGDEFFLSFHYDNIVGIDNMGELYLAGNISRDATDTLTINAKPLSSYIRFEDSQWDIAESDIVYRAGEASFENFLIRNEDQSIAVNGGISRDKADTLTLMLNKLDLRTINHFTDRDYTIRGLTSGRAMIASPMGRDMRAMINLTCDSLEVNKANAGTVKMAAVWDKRSERVSAFIRNITGGEDAINIRAGYGTGSGRINADAKINGFQLALLAPFIPEGIDITEGRLSGHIIAEGHPDSLAISSEGGKIEHARIFSRLNNVAYMAGGSFKVDGTGLTLESMGITDDEGGFCRVGGGILFGGFRNPSLDATLNLDDFKVIGMKNTGGAVYGDLFASGDARLKGPFNSVTLDADLYTNKAGNLHIALGGAASAGISDLLTFTDHTEITIDPYDLMLSELMQIDESRRKAEASNFVAKCRVMATPDLEAVLELDNSGDNYLTARGSGLITLDVEPSRDVMDIAGDYNIANGKYHFALPGIVTKNFNIGNGSSIKFGGDIFETEMDIDASYTLRTSINRLLADTSSVATRRTVNCGIGISGKLREPKLDFSIDIPDLDPTTKSQVESALNTEDKVQKQFLSLVIAGSFLQSEQTGIVNNTDMVFSNVSEMMSRQLSNLLNKIDIPVDLGVGYQQNSAGTDLYDVSVSTELFDSRVEVHGSVGNRQYSRSNNPNGDVVGDLDIDVKLDRPGQLRLNLFSHSADEYTSYLDYSQRNGVGITYQKEFNKWGDFWKSLFRGRRKRQEERENTINEERTVISIEADE